MLHRRAERLAGLRGDLAVEAEERAVLLELLPDVGLRRLVVAVDVVVAERVAEEVRAIDAALDRLAPRSRDTASGW